MQILSFEASGAQVIGYLHEDHERLVAHKIRPAVIVCPGGGYGHLSPREEDAPALEFFTMGCNVFLVRYSVGEGAADFRPLKQLAGAVAYVRAHSAAWHIDPQRIAVMGFSAGGHLAATLGVRWPELGEASRPDALVLCYPVITMGQYTHTGTRDNVTGGREELREVFSLETQITPDFPPSFVWHTLDDASVPAENTLLLAGALRRAGVPFEYHLFASGVHGSSVCTQEVETPNPECREWVQLCKTWLNNRFHYVP